MGRLNTIKKHNAIRKRIETLKAEKFKGKPKYRLDVILEMVAEEFFMSPETITKIYYAPLTK